MICIGLNLPRLFFKQVVAGIIKRLIVYPPPSNFIADILYLQDQAKPVSLKCLQKKHWMMGGGGSMCTIL